MVRRCLSLSSLPPGQARLRRQLGAVSARVPFKTPRRSADTDSMTLAVSPQVRIVALVGVLAAAGLAIATLKAVALWKEVLEARGDRLSAEEMYVWLPQY